MKTVTRNYEVYEVTELSNEARKRAYNNWLSNGCDYPYCTEDYNTLDEFISLFNLRMNNYECSSYTYNFSFKSLNDEEVDELSGLRLYKYLVNNFWRYLFKHKRYYHKDYFVNRKKRLSNIFYTNECVLTGVCSDDAILEPIYNFLKNPNKCTNFLDLMYECLDSFFSYCSKCMEDYESEENFIEECKNNDYTFLSNGVRFE